MVCEPARNGWSHPHFRSTIGGTFLPIHSNILSSFFRLGDAVELGHNGEEAPIEALELALGVVIADLPPVHLQEVTCSRQGLANGGRIGAGSGAGHGECGKLVGVSRVLPRQEELALQVWLGDLEIAQGHADIFCVPADA